MSHSKYSGIDGASKHEHLSDEGFEASQNALVTLIGQSIEHEKNPETTLHRPSTKSSGWLHSIFPESYLEKMETSWHMGNYVIDRRTGERIFEAMSLYVRVGMHLLYYGSQQEKALHWKKTMDLLEAQTRKMGEEYDKPESKAHIPKFIESFQLQDSLADLEEPDPSAYPTFNAFFTRRIRPSARPIHDPHSNYILSSPADSRLTAYPTIDLATKYWIKGRGFSIESLLGSAKRARQFDRGSMIIARLAPQDYHRWHSPCDGTVERITEIPGAYYTVNPQAVNEAGTLDVFCENRRSVMIMHRSATNSPVAIVAVGAMLVGSIRYEDGVVVGADVRRGQCLGAFLYGGSTVIVVVPRGEVKLDEDLVRNSMADVPCETLMRVGWRVGAGPT
ncbi:hypothetical protein K490DRAFT_49440 [Saccharata proteae CBS 121410]|uniref:phosphatidylserine decarboxylase n=1 Tax=Saccharata proteae CBS 121410 TaxID=1314787 RepID=A0A9P4HP03_9PEZI|nr:hypothetical protein K490DRAFT_49440 [Saccharata proteae CBS 121410]